MDKLGICNLACSEIGADIIASLNEASVSAQQCNQQFDQCFKELLEWADWWFARRRTVLAEVPNDRPAEWTYAYQIPTDCATPLLIRPYCADVPQRQFPIAGSGAFPRQDALPIPFLASGANIYTNVGPAQLEYTRNDVMPVELPAMVSRALALEIASRIAYPIKKDMTLADTMVKKAEFQKSRAVADNENQSPRVQHRYISGADLARWGWEGREN